MTELGNKLKEKNNIWDVMAVLTDNLGAEVGKHLEVLLCKELAKE